MRAIVIGKEGQAAHALAAHAPAHFTSALVADQHGLLTSGPDMADGIMPVGRDSFGEPGGTDLRRVTHMTGGGVATCADLASKLLVKFFWKSADCGGPSAQVWPIATVAYPTPADRPANSRLDGSMLLKLHGVEVPVWQTSLKPCVEHLLDEARAQEKHR